jgi:hypothetical protein
LADRLGVGVESLEEEMSHAEFSEWLAYGAIKDKRHEKIDYYLAQIPHAIASIFGGRHSIEDFLVKFRHGETVKKVPPKELAAGICGWFGIKSGQGGI